MLKISKNLAADLSKKAGEMLEKNEQEQTFTIGKTNIKVTLALGTQENIKKYKERIKDTQEYHGKKFLYIT